MKYIQNIIKDILLDQLSKSEGKLAVVIYIILNIFVAIAMLVSSFQGDSKHVIACLKVFLLFIVPYIIEKKIKIQLSSILIIIVQIFMYSSIILGELDSYYVKYPYWDTILHTINGFLCASAGFMFIRLLHEQRYSDKSRALSIHMVVFAFCISMTIGIVWEFYEFGMDNLFDRDMQKDTIVHTIKSIKLDEENNSLMVLKNINEVSVNGSTYHLGGYLDIGLYDTIGDLFNNFIGAIIFCIIGYYDSKRRIKTKALQCFLRC